MTTLEGLQGVFREVFDDGTLVITRETAARDIEDWDSLAQSTPVFHCENVFGLKFDIKEIVALADVGSMVGLTDRKLAGG